MKHWARVGAVAVGGLAAGAAAAAAAGGILWDRETTRAVRRLGAGAGGAPTRVSPDQLAGLPAPVRRYFEFALAPGQPLARRARLTQEGEFLSRSEGAWSPFTAVEHFAVTPPGFVWDASIRIAPLVAVRVRDSYLEGEGAMLGKLGGLVPVVDVRGGPEIAQAALQRYLAEAVWLPPALLPDAGVAWTAVDDTTARATLADRGTSVWIDFRFGSRGEIVGTSTDRYRLLDGRQVLTPWVGRFWAYERVGGLMVPREGEVAWAPPEGRLPYWRGRVTTFAFEPAS
ncbi:MAG: DUF6920 family protein [Deltaproteobacteria bacterium]